MSGSSPKLIILLLPCAVQVDWRGNQVTQNRHWNLRSWVREMFWYVVFIFAFDSAFWVDCFLFLGSSSLFEDGEEDSGKSPANAPSVRVRRNDSVSRLQPDALGRRCTSKWRGSLYDPIYGICCHFCRLGFCFTPESRIDQWKHQMCLPSLSWFPD